MRRLSLPPLLRACLLALLFSSVFALAATRAHADHAMPSVVGKTESQAVRELKALGLDAHVVTVADAPPGRVSEQQPAQGVRVEKGDEIRLRVGVRLKISTTAPRVLGRSEELVLDTLGIAYDLEVSYVTGPRALEGRVIRQMPGAGESINLRGRFVVDVVRNTVIVPVVVGRREEDARRLLEGEGLGVHVRYVPRSGSDKSLVVSQDPRSGAEILPGGYVELRVAGQRPPQPRDVLVRVPDLKGLDLSEAEAELLARGLIPHVHLDTVPGHRAWEVLSQEVPAQKRVAERSPVGLRAAKPAQMAAGLLMPSLYGSDRDHAVELLHHMGLEAKLREQYSALPEGTVFQQDFSAGSPMSAGRVVTIEVAARPPDGWIVPLVLVPDLTSLTPTSAHILLIRLGLLPRIGRESAPDWRVDRVFSQTPAAGQHVRAGSRVVYKLPFRAKVPSLRGKTRTQALDALQAAGLQGIGRLHGPDLPGLTEVVWQEVKSGGVVARGSLVKFTFRKTPVATGMHPVPNVVGKSYDQATALLRNAGFRPLMRPAEFGTGEAMVIRQSPQAGAMRPKGHDVVATYRYVIGSTPDYVSVPSLIGMTKKAAISKLRTLGFTSWAELRGAHTNRGETKVVAQNPSASTQWPRGATVAVTYVVQAPVVTFVKVPNVVGKRLDKALREFQKAGLRARFSRVGTRVKSQEPPAGTRVASGSSVRLKLGF